ncbi:hypothetical protein DNJ95_14015 [Stutzerimonas kirkiae]|uniref:Uncharacterized protein n=1 Tax=Stutzerimonas kirkiae TaxID=2211392 RepID=A0A4Q9R484_9GAMM|nr:hypothetical protein DNJ96_13210 [Stutzerimonas kirkiae]TBV00729.1 hypothetical protein DNJ95_14015 [Stutzerimonas kirkiae]
MVFCLSAYTRRSCIWLIYGLRPYGASLFLACPRKSKQKEGHPNIRPLRFAPGFPRSIAVPVARRGIPAAQPLTRRFHSAS